MSDNLSVGCSYIENSQTSLHKILKNCANFQSSESLLLEDFNDVSAVSICNYYKMISANSNYSTSGNISTSSYASDESYGSENILEENGRISLAYENLRTIPKRIAEKFAAHTKLLDLSYNNFQNLSFLSFFEGLHTLILDRNSCLDVNTFPYLPSLRILWINNCDINNIADWVQRIQMQCPALEHLSIMGNPGIISNFNFSTLTSHIPSEPTTPICMFNDYREYILHVLPNLEYLDGVVRCPSVETSQMPSPHSYFYDYNTNGYGNGKGNKTPSSTTTTTIGVRALNGHCNHKTHADNRLLSNNPSKSSHMLDFKELFRLRRRKKSYQSSSTN